MSSFANKASLMRVDRKAYFAAFNFTDLDEQKRGALLEKEMTDHSDEIIEWINENSGELNHEAGMYLVYTAMLVLERNNGLLQGLLHDSTMTRDRLSSRYDLAQHFLNQAMVLAPKDNRIHSWEASCRFRGEQFKLGTPTEATFDRLIDLVESSPIFNVFNALIMSSDTEFGAEREAKILAKANLLAGKESPCWPPVFRSHEIKEQCHPTSKTPFAIQGVSTYLGDEFLKHSVAVQKDKPDESKEYLEKANQMYQRLKFFLFSHKTKKWAQRANLDARIEFVNQLKSETPPTHQESFFKTRTFLNIYTCYGCHQNGTSRTDLKVSLPASKSLGE